MVIANPEADEGGTMEEPLNQKRTTEPEIEARKNSCILINHRLNLTYNEFSASAAFAASIVCAT